MIDEEDYLQLSGIQHFAFCPRQWALIHVESQWADNWRTVSGSIMHERAHNEGAKERRGDTITLRALRVASHTLGLSGQCDIVEFRIDEDGVPLNGHDGKYRPFPIEYKRGKEKPMDADEMQLCAQAICLEEMLLCDIPAGALFYGETHRRKDVEFADALRRKVRQASADMHKFMRSGTTPMPVRKPHCKECSLNSECAPMLQDRKPVSQYIREHIEEA